MNAGASRHRSAFTLIELIVVIAIIAALMGLTVGVAVTVHRKSETRATENILRLLDAALQDWEASSERRLTWWVNGQNYDGSSNVNAKYDLNAFDDGEDQNTALLTKLRNTPSTAQILAQINQDFFVKHAATNSQPERILINDPWGKEIIVLHPGPLRTQLPAIGSYMTNADGTILTTNNMFPSPPSTYEIYESRLGVCANRRICFVSAGPDLRFGNLHLTTALNALSVDELTDIAQTQDNLTSYPLTQERLP